MPRSTSVSRVRMLPLAGALIAAVACGRGRTGDTNFIAPDGESARMAVSPVSAMLRIGDTLRYSAPRGACDLSTARWSTSNPNVLSVDPVLGLVTARDVGAATVRLQQPGCGLTIAPGSASVIP